jgi:hypothetical protein
MLLWMSILHTAQRNLFITLVASLVLYIINYLIINAIIQYKNYRDLRFISSNNNFFIYLLRHIVSGKSLWISFLLLPVELIVLYLAISGL